MIFVIGCTRNCVIGVSDVIASVWYRDSPGAGSSAHCECTVQKFVFFRVSDEEY